MVNLQTKYTLIDEQDIPLVEGYSFEVRMATPLPACFWSVPGEGRDGRMGFLPCDMRATWLPLPCRSPTPRLLALLSSRPNCAMFASYKPGLPRRLPTATSPRLSPDLGPITPCAPAPHLTSASPPVCVPPSCHLLWKPPHLYLSPCFYRSCLFRVYLSHWIVGFS